MPKGMQIASGEHWLRAKELMKKNEER